MIKIKKIEQIDNYTFALTFQDDLIKRYRLSDIQKNCPCAKCVDETTGKRLNQFIDPEVKAITIKNVGQYALNIHFISGCSLGIYTFDALYKW